jgi:hypothetical protein
LAITSTMTAGEIVVRAMELIGAKDSRTTLQGEDMTLGVSQLNWMLKSWQAQGCNLWRKATDSVVFSADTPTVTLDPYVIDVQEARLVVTTDPLYERWLDRWEWGEYVVLPNKLASSQPTIFVLDKQRAAVTMTLWPVSPEAITINYTYARVVEDVVNSASTVDVPQAWLEAVYYGLADRLLDPFSVTESQPRVAARIQARAASLYQQMLDLDRPQSVFFEPFNATPYSRGVGYGY